MKTLLLLLARLLTAVARHLGPGDANAVIAENLLLKQQLLVINRARRRAPNLTPLGCQLSQVFTSHQNRDDFRAFWRLLDSSPDHLRLRRISKLGKSNKAIEIDFK